MTSIAAAASSWEMTSEERSDADALLTTLEAAERTIAAAEALKAATTAELRRIAEQQRERTDSESEYEFPHRSMGAEVASALRVSPRTAQARLEEAAELVEGFPATQAALSSGFLTRAHAREIVAAGGHLTGRLRARFERRIIPEAETRTPGQLRRIARALVEQVRPSSFAERHGRARDRRGVFVTDLDDGMSELCAVLPSPLAHGIHDRLTQMGHTVISDRRAAAREKRKEERRLARRQARAAAHDGDAPGLSDPAISPHERDDEHATRASAGLDAGIDPDSAGAPPSPRPTRADASVEEPIEERVDTRTLSHVRADLLSDILVTASPTAHRLHAAGTEATLAELRATVQVAIPVAQITTPDTATAAPTIDEALPIDAESARVLAGQASGWDRLFIAVETGDVMRTDRYQPTAAQRRMLVARDLTCRFPGCNQPARRSDVDHTVDYARGGETRVGNLGHLCRSHHMVKHHSPWSVMQRDGGVFEWTSPTGRRYRSDPASRVMFTEGDDPPDPSAPF
ncbi:HNH endonuclease signature motif containing protein [Microbacterium sp. G2-8]|uniref:HNH endonuclease signature motif containing protein n=1 Tax=Microbacterium sp. G2-8 TaxID=2842454 RepID=UPI001C896DF8|nr:HNH endonuclease signature motif containing protein [Microbacterium sp. G2-8]